MNNYRISGRPFHIALKKSGSQSAVGFANKYVMQKMMSPCIMQFCNFYFYQDAFFIASRINEEQLDVCANTFSVFLLHNKQMFQIYKHLLTVSDARTNVLYVHVQYPKPQH